MVIKPSGRSASRREIARYLSILVVALGTSIAGAAADQSIKLVERAPDPHGSPRPFREARDVPLRTSIYLELATPQDVKPADPELQSVAVSLKPDQGEVVDLLG